MAECTAQRSPRRRHGGGVARDGRDSSATTDRSASLILIVLEALAILVPLLIGVAYLTYAERKVLAAMQLRKGPNVVGPFGLLQPFADALKMLMQGDDHPDRRQPRAVPDGADADLRAGAARPGR